MIVWYWRISFYNLQHKPQESQAIVFSTQAWHGEPRKYIYVVLGTWLAWWQTENPGFSYKLAEYNPGGLEIPLVFERIPFLVILWFSNIFTLRWKFSLHCREPCVLQCFITVKLVCIAKHLNFLVFIDHNFFPFSPFVLFIIIFFVEKQENTVESPLWNI